VSQQSGDGSDSGAFELSTHPVHLGLGATVQRLGHFTGTPEWYEAYAGAHERDGAEGRLVSLHTFDAPWQSWEAHPLGEELVLCVSGRIVLHQELGDDVRTVSLSAGEAVVNPAGVWHTADVDPHDGGATVLFVTAGAGTTVRPR
jgi:hypothetical protein